MIYFPSLNLYYEKKNATSGTTIKSGSYFLNLELYIYPMQQKHLKKQIQWMISNHSLPFKVFSALFPRIVEVAKPKSGLVFELFRFFSENPDKEISGRYYWANKGMQQFYRYKTMCQVTRDALLSAIFDRRLQNCPFEEVKGLIQQHAQNLNDNFYVYNFEVPSKQFFLGHTFVVIQYLDQGVKYRIFQSFVGKYCLKTYLKNHDAPLTHGQFMLFLEELEICVLSDKWSSSQEEIYKKWFGAEGCSLGESNPCRDLRIEWGMATMEDVLIQKKKFDLFKKSELFPKIPSAGCFCCDRNDALERKYREIYDSEEVAFGRINADVNTLGLDLSERGQLDIPARTADGRLIVDGADLVWTTTAVTLRKAAKDVISELNKVKCQQGILLLNTNKEPFMTYDNLRKDGNDQGWVRRIIDALVSQGHLLKLVRVNGHGYFVQTA